MLFCFHVMMSPLHTQTLLSQPKSPRCQPKRTFSASKQISRPRFSAFSAPVPLSLPPPASSRRGVAMTRGLIWVGPERARVVVVVASLVAAVVVVGEILGWVVRLAMEGGGASAREATDPDTDMKQSNMAEKTQKFFFEKLLQFS